MRFSNEHWRINPLGDRAMLLNWNLPEENVYMYLQWVQQQLKIHPFPGFIEAVVAFDALAIYYDPLPYRLQAPHLHADNQITAHLENLLQTMPFHYKRKQTEIEIPVCYELNLDLQALCDQTGMCQSQLIEMHAAVTYEVACIGFTPGFPYLLGLPDVLQTARRETPRVHVPAGSVAVGGPYCGVYPFASPGGWHVIGRTPIKLFDADRTPPAFLRVGDTVRFQPISVQQFERLAGEEGFG